MSHPVHLVPRRGLLVGVTATLAAPFVIGRALAQAPPRTPRQTEGPFYPRDWRGDADSDLVQVTGEAARAMGTVLHLQGRVLRAGGALPGATVEIWQCDANGVYRHPLDENPTRRRDRAFQGRGRAVTDAEGRYRFRTIRPVAYPGRTPHIHFKVIPPRGGPLTTQMYVFGEALNAGDGVLNAIRDPRLRDALIVRLDRADNLEPGALGGTFDILVG